MSIFYLFLVAMTGRLLSNRSAADSNQPSENSQGLWEIATMTHGDLPGESKDNEKLGLFMYVMLT